MFYFTSCISLWLIVLVSILTTTVLSLSVRQPSRLPLQHHHHDSFRRRRYFGRVLSLHAAISEEEPQKKIIQASASLELNTILSSSSDTKDTTDQQQPDEGAAVTGSINERLMSELQQAADKEKFGAKSSLGEKLGFSGRKRGTPEQQEAALREARDLNGVDPVVSLLGGIFALAVAGALWYATNELGSFFVLHPVETDVYFVQRLASVFRNVVMGMVSLASGFFGVTGMGIFLMGVRVAIGVAKGELDPTPIATTKDMDKPEMPNVWELMMNKKPTRSGGRSGGNNDKNPFGL